MGNRLLGAGLIIALTILYFVDVGYKTSKKKYETVNVFSQNADGLSIFYELSKRAYDGSVEVSKEAFLEEIDPQVYSALLILSPKLPISTREVELIETYLKKGGHLVLSVVNLQELAVVKPILATLKIDTETFVDKDFVNREVREIEVSDSSGLLKEKEIYSIYSARQLFKDTLPEKSDNYFISKVLGKGRADIMLGIPVFSNALISLNDNREIAFRILEKPGKVLVDEYRHFYTNKTISDLLFSPSFFIPFFGIGILIFIFLLFSDSSDIDDFALELEKDVIGYHELNSQLVLGLWKSKKLLNDALIRQATILSQKFPNHQDNFNQIIDKIKVTEDGTENFNHISEDLILIHKEILREKGIK